MTNNDMRALETELNDYLKVNNCNHYVGYTYTHSVGHEFLCEINWGDWKHDHLRIDMLVTKFFDNNPEYELIHYMIDPTEEDGSDAYSALHYWYVKERKEMNENFDSHRYFILGITDDNKKKYYNETAETKWVDNIEDATTYDDMLEARNIWSELPREGFKRIVVPIYPESTNETLEESIEYDDDYNDMSDFNLSKSNKLYDTFFCGN